MQKILGLLALVLVLTVPVTAQQWSYKKTAATVTVAGAAVSLFTAADVQAGSGHPQATQAQCTLTTANIRVTYDGTTPTTNLGLVLTPGVYIVTGTETLVNMQGIRDDSTSASWDCAIVGQ